MNTRLSSLALREARTHLSQRSVLLGLIGSALILGISGPFGTFDVLSAVPRIGYWVLIVFCTYSLAIFGLELAKSYIPKTLSPILRDAIAGLLVGPFIGLSVIMINAAVFFGLDSATSRSFTLILYTTLITCVLSVVIGSVVVGHASTQTDQPNAQQTHPALLQRLPHEKRGALMSLQA